jgi:hypothetical protein|tara:strand:- start:41 stop:847 length:807 start_codon:yes stop_codon:yes gene_type:complete
MNYKDNYVYFRKRSHFSCLANTGGNLQKSDALTAANFGIVPANFTAGASTDAARGIEVVIRTGEANDDTRGTAISALLDFSTGAAFAADVQDTVIGDASHLTFPAMGIASGVLTIANFGADGTDGYLIDATDQWIIRETVASTNDALTDVPAAQQRATFNMRHYLGCDPVDTGTAAVVGVDVDGTAVEKTKISFRGGDGGATVDYVVLTHAANKFKDVAAAMEELANGDYHRTAAGIYTFTDLITSGGAKATKQEIELGIVGCHMVNA